MLNRRQLIIASPALGLLGMSRELRAQAARGGEQQKQLAAIWNRCETLPYIRSQRALPDTRIAGYMFTIRGDLVTKAFHEKYRYGFRHLDLRYIVLKHKDDPPAPVNHLYGLRTEEAYFSFMFGKFKMPRDASEPDRVDEVYQPARALNPIVQGGFGVPYFLFHTTDVEPGQPQYLHGAINQFIGMFDALVG